MKRFVFIILSSTFLLAKDVSLPKDCLHIDTVNINQINKNIDNATNIKDKDHISLYCTNLKDNINILDNKKDINIGIIETMTNVIAETAKLKKIGVNVANTNHYIKNVATNLNQQLRTAKLISNEDLKTIFILDQNNTVHKYVFEKGEISYKKAKKQQPQVKQKSKITANHEDKKLINIVETIKECPIQICAKTSCEKLPKNGNIKPGVKVKIYKSSKNKNWHYITPNNGWIYKDCLKITRKDTL